MLEAAHSVVVLLTSRYSHRLVLMNLVGGDSEDVLMTPEGAMIVQPGVAVAGLHCIETGENLILDRDYALFHTGKPAEFVEQFVPVLRMAIEQVGWIQVRDSLKSYLNSLG